MQLTWDRLRVRWFLEGGLPKGVRLLGAAIETVEKQPSLVGKAHAAGYPVHVYTVDRTEQVHLCLELGVDAIITNRPGHVLELLGRAAPAAPSG